MRPSGLEPPRTVKSTRPSTLRVYQFRHGRRVGEYTRAVALDGWSEKPATCIRPQGTLHCEHMFVEEHHPHDSGGIPAWT